VYGKIGGGSPLHQNCQFRQKISQSSLKTICENEECEEFCDDSPIPYGENMSADDDTNF